MAVEIVFETHSVTTDNEAGLATGWLDGQLSERGRALATELGRRRRNDAVAAVFASDLGRAVETVELAFGGSDVPVYLDARLRECDYGPGTAGPSPASKVSGRSGSAGHSLTARATCRSWPCGQLPGGAGARLGWDPGSGGRPFGDPLGLGPLLAGAALNDLVAAPFDWREG